MYGGNLHVHVHGDAANGVNLPALPQCSPVTNPTLATSTFLAQNNTLNI